MKILIVEDDKNLNNTMAEALKAFADSKFLMVKKLYFKLSKIFWFNYPDVMLPRDGFAILETIRKIVMFPLTGQLKTMVEDRVKD